MNTITLGSLPVTFNDASLLEKALTHPSMTFVKEAPRGGSGQNLEQVGCLAWTLIASAELTRRGFGEGFIHTSISNILRPKLEEISLAWAVWKQIHVSYGLQVELLDSKMRKKVSMQGLLAIMGAIYLDQGLEPVKLIVDAAFGSTLRELNGEMVLDPKSELQEICQRDRKCTPTYTIESADGPEHGKTFRVSASIQVDGQKTVLGYGNGTSKRTAERDAAINALQKLKT